MRNKYAQATEAERPMAECGPSLKQRKERLVQMKNHLEDFINVTDTVDMDYKERHTIVGQMYMNIQYEKAEIKRIKAKVKK